MNRPQGDSGTGIKYSGQGVKDSAQGIKVGDYAQLNQIGEGSFGTIYEAMNLKDNKLYAVKQLDKKRILEDEEESRNFKSEVSIMKEIKNFHIIKLFDFMESDKYYYLAMQLCSDGDLTKYMKKKGIKHFTEKNSVYFIAQISQAFRRLHKDKVMHRDFKLDNIFIDKGNVVLGDLGFAKKGSDTSDEQVGTPYYLAPEIFESKTYTNLADLWSVGVVFYQLLFGKLPFDGNDMQDLYNNIKKNAGDKLNFPQEVNDISVSCQNLLRSILQTDPKKRMTWKEFFNHPLFDEENLNQKKQRLGDFLARFFVSKAGYDVVFSEFSKAKEEANLNFEVSLQLMETKDMNIKQAVAEQITEEELTNFSTGIGHLFMNSNKTQEYKLGVARYHHDISKIQFMWHTLAEMDKIIKTEVLGQAIGCEPSDFAFSGMNLNCIMAKKAMTMWYLNYNAIKNKKNVFGIKEFKNFVMSDTFKSGIYCEDVMNKEYETYWNNVELEIEMLMLNDDQNFEIERLYNNLLQPVIDEMAESCFKKLLNFFSTDEYKVQTNEWKNLFAKHMIYMYYGINCEDTFKWSPDWADYEWINIYKKHDEQSNKTLEDFLLTKINQSDKQYILVK